MRQKTSLFNKGLFVQDLRSVGWIGIVYFLLLLAVGPLQILLNVEHYHKTIMQSKISNEVSLPEFLGSAEAYTILTCILPVALAMLLFRYLHTKLAGDYIHSLPIKRNALFHQRMLTGIGILVLPLFLNALIMLGVGQGYHLGEAYSMKSVGLWLITVLLFNLLVFTGSTFVAMFTGMSLLQGVFTYIMFVFPVGILMLSLQYADLFLFGFSSFLVRDSYTSTLFPGLRMAHSAAAPLSIIEWIVYIVLILAFYVVALFLYKRRKTETATQAIVVKPLRPVFKYGVTACFMLTGGIYFGDFQKMGWIIFGFIVGSLIGYSIATMILEKTWRILYKWKGYIGFAIVASISLLLLNMDIFGYENNVPQDSEVKRVYVSSEIPEIDRILATDEELEEQVKRGEISPGEVEMYYRKNFFTDRTNIHNVTTFQKEIVKDKNELELIPEKENNMVVFVYELKNGDKEVRKYNLPPHKYDNLYKPIVESDEYKKNLYNALRINENQIDRIVLSSGIGFDDKQEVLTDQSQMKDLLRAVKQDIKNQKYKEIQKGTNTFVDIELIQGKNEPLIDSIPSTFNQTMKWLKDHQIYKEIVPMASDFDYVVVQKWDPTVSEGEVASTDKITDKDKINQLIKLASNAGYEYRMEFHSKSGHSIYETGVHYEDLPNDIKKQLN